MAYLEITLGIRGLLWKHFARFAKNIHFLANLVPQNLSKTLLKYSSSTGSIEKLTCYVNCFQLAFKPRSKINCISTPVALSIWKHGKLVYVVGQTDNGYAVEEIGSLNFAVEFCNGVQRFYDAIGYIPPGGDQFKRMRNLMECIVEEEVLLQYQACLHYQTQSQDPLFL